MASTGKHTDKTAAIILFFELVSLDSTYCAGNYIRKHLFSFLNSKAIQLCTIV